MLGQEARLVQYRVLADHRLHFGRLYFQVIGTNLALATGAMLAIALGRSAWWTPIQLLVGFLLMGTGLVAHRLHCQEERYAAAMREIEKADGDMVRLPDMQGHGARWWVVVVLWAVGVALACEAGRHLLWQAG